MPEHPDEGVENRDSLSDDLESMRLQDLDSTLRGAPGRLDEPIKLEFDLLGELLHNLMRAITIAIFPATAAFLATFGLWSERCSPGSARPRATPTTRKRTITWRSGRPTSSSASSRPSERRPRTSRSSTSRLPTLPETTPARPPTSISVSSPTRSRSRGARTSSGPGRAEELVAPTNLVRAAVADAYHVWTSRLDTTPGRIAVTLRMVDSPPEVMALYERSHPRAD